MGCGFGLEGRRRVEMGGDEVSEPGARGEKLTIVFSLTRVHCADRQSPIYDRLVCR